MGLSRRAYARHRGVVENAVRKAIASGRITLEDDDTIDPVKADKSWGESSDPIKPLNLKPALPKAGQRSEPIRAKRAVPEADNDEASVARRGAPKPVPVAAVEAVRETLREAGREIESPTAAGMTFVQARTANEVMKAQERRVRLAKLKGELVDKARATATVFALARRERDAWVQWPARASALIAAELQADPHKVEQVLEAHVRRHLEELSGVAVELR